MDETITTESTAPEITVATEPLPDPVPPAETTEATVPATTETVPTVPEVPETTEETEFIPAETIFTTPTEMIPEETITVVDYTPIIVDTGTNICEVILFGCLCICGVLCALRLWEVRSS